MMTPLVSVIIVVVGPASFPQAAAITTGVVVVVSAALEVQQTCSTTFQRVLSSLFSRITATGSRVLSSLFSRTTVTGGRGRSGLQDGGWTS